MACRASLFKALLLIAILDSTTSQGNLFDRQRTFDDFERPEAAQFVPIPVIPLPAGLSALKPLHNRPAAAHHQGSSALPSRPTKRPQRFPSAQGSNPSRPIPTVPKPNFPLKPLNPSTRPPPPTPSLPINTRPTPPPPPPPPAARPTTTQRTTTTDAPPEPTTTESAPEGQPGGETSDLVFSIFRMSDDGSYLFDYQTSGTGLRQREEGFLKMIGSQKVPVKKGFFAYTSPEGKPISLSYEADELGFRATGDHLPDSKLHSKS